ncbi:phosphoesterase [Sulfolobales archaeon HS-7]|nr:phosphoesterase [Sulfolobales archaeon HS-7]
MPDRIKIAFSTDIHGSREVFSKVLTNFKKNSANYLVLGADLFSNEIMVVEKNGNEYFIDGRPISISKLNAIKNKTGINVVPSNLKDEVMKSVYEQQKENAMFFIERSKDIADKVVWSFGHTDPEGLEKIFSEYGMKVGNGTIIELENLTLITLGEASNTETGIRVVPDYTLYNRGKEMLSKVDPQNCILNSHMPPLQSGIDETRKDGKKVNLGSKAILDLIKEFRPLLGLHGHVHEPIKNSEKIGDTFVVNPGSYYTEGFFTMSIIEIERERKSIGSFYQTSYKVKKVNHLTDYRWEPAFGV